MHRLQMHRFKKLERQGRRGDQSEAEPIRIDVFETGWGCSVGIGVATFCKQDRARVIQGVYSVCLTLQGVYALSRCEQ
jgi:hypothetical protein